MGAKTGSEEGMSRLAPSCADTNLCESLCLGLPHLAAYSNSFVIKKILIEVSLIYNVVLVSSVQQSDSAICIFISI